LQLRLRHGEISVLVKILQTWKLHIICYKLILRDIHQTESRYTHGAITEVVLLSMALLAIAQDSSLVGSSEANKALEIELG
jgi:hypothetical protein